MALSMTESILGLSGLTGMRANPGTLGTPQAGAVSLAGFDAVIQVSRRLMQAVVEQSLSVNNVDAPGAMAPWNSVALPASVLAAIPPRVRNVLSIVPAYVEVRLVEPYLAAFHWPQTIVISPTGPAAPHVVGHQSPSVDLGWQLQINLAQPRLTLTPGETARTLPAGSFGPPIPPRAVNVAPPAAPNTDSYDRTTLATASVTMPATAYIDVNTKQWCFGVNLDFSATSPTITSGDTAVTDFLTTGDGKNLCDGALAPLKVAVVQLTPEVAPGGSLSATAAQAGGMTPFSVQDILLSDANGNPVICLCVHLGSASGGVARLVQPFLNFDDFAYAVSTSVLSPALKARWAIAAAGLANVAIVPVDIPPSDGNAGFTGTARLRTTFSNKLDDVSMRAAADNGGDTIRLLSSMTVQLLQLWDSTGKQVTDLGPLAQPAESPLVVPIRLFDKDAADGAAPPAGVANLLVQLLATMVYPLLNPLPIDPTTISGYASAALQTLAVRWSLTKANIVAPTSGVFEA